MIKTDLDLGVTLLHGRPDVGNPLRLGQGLGNPIGDLLELGQIKAGDLRFPAVWRR